ncbi:MAG: ABC transporter ATP-binding protein [Oscillospiraceae bacterium]|nr:ABC transporter ATP-binding protein [Oscillospiraceae bacterium]
MAEQRPMRGPRGGGPGGGPRGGFQKPKNAGKTIKRLMGYLAPNPLPLIVVLICVVVASVTNIAGSYYGSRVIINKLAYGQYNGVGELAANLLVLVAIFGGSVVASYLQSFIMMKLAHRGVNRLRRDLFDRLQDMPLSYFDRHPHGELMSRFTNDADNVLMAMEQSMVSLISSAITFIGVVAMMIYIGRLLFLVVVCTLFITLLCFKVFGGKSRKYYQQQQSALGALNGNIQEMIEGLKVVKAFTHEKEAKEEFAQLNEDYRGASTNASFFSMVIMPISMQMSSVAFAISAAIGGAMVIFAGLDVGGLVAFLGYTRQVSQPMQQISMQMTNILSALAGAERIFDAMDAEPEQDDGNVTLVPAEKDGNGVLHEYKGGGRTKVWAWKTPASNPMELVRAQKDGNGGLIETASTGEGTFPAWKYVDHTGAQGLHRLRGAVGKAEDGSTLTELTGAVRLTGVDFSYVPDKPVLKKVTVFANPGQKIAFVGSTGAGKTTITNLINRFYEIQGGTITYDGIDVQFIEKDSLRHSMGVVLQDTHLFTGTVMDNIRYGRLDATDEECIEAAKTANAHSFIRRLPQGYQTVITGDGANLSQGQRQLLAIARAAVADPPVMVLDEATSSIDTRTEQLIQRGMDSLMEGRTVFVIAHRLSTVRNSNCIVVIEHGEIEEKGSHEELLEQQGRYYKLYTGQFKLS